MEETIEEIIFNFGGNVRSEMLEEREHIVVPCVMMLEGVYTGSKGPMLYRGERISNNVENWNSKPITIRHPSNDGTANNYKILNKQKVGIILNTRYSNKKVSSEAWLDKNRLLKHSPDIHDKILRGEKIEVSTGMIAKCRIENGNFEGKDYIGEVMEIVPDHLALLPDSKGAFSVGAGAGLLQNSEFVETFTQMIFNKINSKSEKSSMEKNDMIAYLIKNSTVSGWTDADKADLEAAPESLLKKTVTQVKERIENDSKLAKEAADKKAAEEAAKLQLQNQSKGTVQDYLATVPPEFRQVLASGLSKLEAERKGHIETILAVQNCRYTEAALAAKDVEELEVIVDMIKNAAPVQQTVQNNGKYLPRSGGFDNSARNQAELEKEAALMETGSLTK